eukprot:scaffold2566_cov125-Alexandrium_tamarense.AAC.31
MQSRDLSVLSDTDTITWLYYCTIQALGRIASFDTTSSPSQANLLVLQSDGYQTAILLSSAEDFGIALKGYLLEQSEGVASYFTLGQQIWWPLRVPVSAQRHVFKMKRAVCESKF